MACSWTLSFDQDYVGIGGQRCELLLAILGSWRDSRFALSLRDHIGVFDALFVGVRFLMRHLEVHNKQSPPDQKVDYNNFDIHSAILVYSTKHLM